MKNTIIKKKESTPNVSTDFNYQQRHHTEKLKFLKSDFTLRKRFKLTFQFICGFKLKFSKLL